MSNKQAVPNKKKTKAFSQNTTANTKIKDHERGEKKKRKKKKRKRKRRKKKEIKRKEKIETKKKNREHEKAKQINQISIFTEMFGAVPADSRTMQETSLASGHCL